MDDVILTTCYPDTDTKMELLRDLLIKIRNTTPIPVALSTHLYVPKDIIDLVSYYLYDKDDAPSNNYTIYYHYDVPGDLHLKTKRLLPYHALSGYTSVKSSVTLFRNKFSRLHYIQYDTEMNIPEYISMATEKLYHFNFVGAEYRVPNQLISGIVGTFFSVNTKWFDDHMPLVSTWDEWKAYGRDNNDNLMGENWLHNYFTDHSMIPSCYFLQPSEFPKYILNEKIQTKGNSEPGLQIYLSELSDHKLILFIHLYAANGNLSFTINRNGYIKPINLSSGVVYWETIEKSGYLIIQSNSQVKEFIIDPSREYTDTLFKFHDDKLKCLREM